MKAAINHDKFLVPYFEGAAELPFKLRLAEELRGVYEHYSARLPVTPFERYVR